MKDEYNRQYRATMKKIKSSLLGYAHGMYSSEPRCPKCGGELTIQGSRFYCKCGWRSRRQKNLNLDYSAYMDGLAMNKRLLK